MSIDLQTTGVHHIALRVRDFERAQELLCGDARLSRSCWSFRTCFIFLAGSTAIAVRGPEAGTPATTVSARSGSAWTIVALGCAKEEELERVAAALARADVPNTGVKLDEVLGKRYVAFKDPDGIAWEFYCRGQPGRARRWRRTSTGSGART